MKNRCGWCTFYFANTKKWYAMHGNMCPDCWYGKFLKTKSVVKIDAKLLKEREKNNEYARLWREKNEERLREYKRNWKLNWKKKKLSPLIP